MFCISSGRNIDGEPSTTPGVFFGPFSRDSESGRYMDLHGIAPNLGWAPTIDEAWER